MSRPLALLAVAAPVLALAAVAPAAPAPAASGPVRIQLPSPNTVGLTGDTVQPLDPPNQVRSAYGVTGSKATGKGRTVAILLSGYMSMAESDADRFFTAHGLDGFAPGQYRQMLSPDIDSTCEAQGSTGDEFEATIDIEGAHVAAPDANILFDGLDCTGNLNQLLDIGLDGAQQIVDQHLADVVSGSWGIEGDFASPAEMVPWDSMLQEGALEGMQADAGQVAGRPLGFLNPALYRLAGRAAVRDITAVDPADPPIQAGLNEYGEFDPGYLITVGEDGPPDSPGILTATTGYDDATGIGAPTPGFVGSLARS